MSVPDVPALMRATVFGAPGAPEVLSLAQLPTPAPVLSELLVRVVAAGVNPIDAKTRAGGGSAAAIAAYPAVLGNDVSGVVVRAPDESHPLQPGTPVFGMLSFPRTHGAYAQYAVAPSLQVARKPDALTHVEAAAVPIAALTAWGAVVQIARAHPGQRMLVHAGAGGVGHFAVQLGAHFGAEVVTTASARNAAWLRDLGAAQVIDHRTTRFERVVADIDVVIDLIGNVHDEVGSRSLQVLRPGGLYVIVPSGGWPGYAQAAVAAGVRATHYKVVPDGAVLARIGAMLAEGALRVHVDRVFDLGDAAAAHRELERGRTRGKLVLRVGED